MKLDSYYAMRPRMQTGDLLFFSGRGVASRVIRWFTRSRFSHVGVIVNVWSIDALFVYESTTLSRLPDVSSGLRRRGVQMTLMSERLRRFRGGCVWRPLVCDRSVPEFWEGFKEFRAEMSGRRYERNVRELVRAGREVGSRPAGEWEGGKALSRVGRYEEEEEEAGSVSYLRTFPPSHFPTSSLSSVFCSELVAALYGRWGLWLEGAPVAREWSPADLAGRAADAWLKPGARLLPGIEL